jgi:Fe-S-cluster containining protein
MTAKTAKTTEKKEISALKTLAKEWWHEGVRFQCQGSGQCCTSHGEYGFVFLDKNDRKLMAKHLGLKPQVFTKKYCTKYNGAYHLIEDPSNPDCMFLKNKRCQVYEARPTQCRTWPFWPEVMKAKTWNKEVLSFCPGVGKGSLVPKSKIESQLAEQAATEKAIVHEALYSKSTGGKANGGKKSK